MTAIYFHTEAYSIQTSRLMGRHAAGHGFLRAWLKYCSQARYEALVADRSQAEAFRATVKALGAEKSSDLFDWYAADALQQAGALFFQGPVLATMPGIGEPCVLNQIGFLNPHEALAWWVSPTPQLLPVRWTKCVNY